MYIKCSSGSIGRQAVNGCLFVINKDFPWMQAKISFQGYDHLTIHIDSSLRWMRLAMVKGFSQGAKNHARSTKISKFGSIDT